MHVGRVIYSRLCDTLNGHPIGKPLSQISARSEELPDLRDKYLEDFLCTRALGSNDIHKVHVRIGGFTILTQGLALRQVRD